MSVVNNAVQWMLSIAGDSSHGYDQGSRWGPDYDCSSLVISAYEQAGIPVKTKGATYTGNMYKVFINCGFVDVTNSVTLSTGEGLVFGDVLLNTKKHTAVYIGNGEIVHASINENGGALGGKTGDQTGKEICTRSYYNYPWDKVLRYPSSGSGAIPTVSKSDIYKGNNYLTDEQILVNATYICAWLLDKGWTLNAVCGVLGNMARESHCNPELWQSLEFGNSSGGFGITQWTPATKLISWATENNMDYADIDSQLLRLYEEMQGQHDQYYPTSSYPETGEEFTSSVKTPEYLVMAFLKNYERAGVEAVEERVEWANYFFNYFSRFTPDIEKAKRKIMSLLLMYLATRR